MPFSAKIIRLSFIVLFSLTPLFFLPYTSELFEFNKIVLVYLITITAASAWLAEMLLQKKILFRRTPLDIPLLAFLAVLTISTLVSIDPRTSLMGYYSRFNGGLVSIFCYSLLYWAYVTHMDKKATLQVMGFGLISALTVSAWGFLEHFGIDKTWWVQDVQNRVFSTLGQPNWLAAYLVAIFFIPLSRIKSLTTKSGLLHAAAALLIFTVLVFTKSRSGFLALAVASGVYWLMRIRQEKIVSSLRTAIPLHAVMLLLLLLVRNPLSDMLFRPKLPPAPTAAGPALEVGGTESGQIRNIVWKGAVAIWQSSTKTVLLGTGPETFTHAYYQFRPIEHNMTSEWELLYNKAHNEFLNYLSTTGLLGFTSYLSVLGFSLYQLYQSWKKTADPSNRPLQSALLAGWISLPVTNYWGFSTVVPQLCLYLFPALAISLQTESDSHKKPPKISGNMSLILISTLTLASIFYFLVFRYWVADINYAAGQKNLRAFSMTQDPNYALTSYQKFSSAYSGNSADPAISSDLSIIAAYMALLTVETSPATASDMTEVAISASNRSVAISPRHPNYWKNRSKMFIVLSTLKPELLTNARQALEQAALISPTDPRIPFNLGVIANYQEEPDQAVAFFQKALQLKPDFHDAAAQLETVATMSASATPSSTR